MLDEAEYAIVRALIDHLPDRIAVTDAAGRSLLCNPPMCQQRAARAPELLERAIETGGPPPPVATPIAIARQRTIPAGRSAFSREELLVDAATGARSWVITTSVPARDSRGAVVGWVSISRDVTRCKRAEQQLALRAAATRIISEAESRESVVPKFLEAVGASVGLDLAELWWADTSANCLRWEGAWHARSLPAERFVAARRTTTFARGGDLPGQVWATGELVQLGSGDSGGDTPQRSLAARLGLRHCLGFPIHSGSAVAGALVLWSRAAIPLDAELSATLADLGRQLALLFERMRAEARLRQYVRRVVDAQEAERDHVARELHDEIAQALALIKLNVRAVQRRAPESDLAPHLEQSLGLIEETLQRVRAMAVDLRPSMLDDLGLVPTLRWYLERHARWAGLDAEVIVESFESRIPKHLETICFRVAQEALSNVVRHAQAQTVRVKLSQRAGAVHMLIRDDGAGFDVLAAQERAADGASMGLVAMEDRVLLAGGELAIESAPGRGTTVWLRLPLSRGTAAGAPEANRDLREIK